jgi:hypothetical protein
MKLAGFPVNEELLSSETLAHYGGVDVVVPRRHMKTRISRCLQLGQEPTESLACERYSTSGHDLGRWYAGFSSRMSALLDEAHEILAFESGSRMVETPVLTQLSHVALVSIPRLFRHIAARSPDARVRASAIEALGRFRGDDHTHLVEALRDPHRRVCTNAAVALLCDDPKNAEAMAVLQSLMASADPVDRRAGLYGLVRIPIDALRDDLRRLTNDPVVSVQLSAAVALIVSQDLPTGRDALRNVVSIMGRSALGQARRLARYAPPGTLETLEAVMAEFESELASARTPPAPA